MVHPGRFRGRICTDMFKKWGAFVDNRGVVRPITNRSVQSDTIYQGATMNYYQQHQSDFLEGLKTFLRIPSISALSENKADIRRAADFALNELRAAGMT